MNYICEKVLEDGNKLAIKTWKSDVISPGRQMFQLDLIKEERGVRSTIQFPTKYENFSEADIRNMYAIIQTKQDFDKIRKSEG